MEPIVLTDPNVEPNSDLIFSIIGDKYNYWQKIIDYLYENHQDITEEWRFYNDGKSWLYRTLRKKNTIYWIGIQKDTFRVSFWLSEKALPMIEASSLPDRIKEEYRNAKPFNHSRCVTVIMNLDGDFENVLKLIELKLKIK
ncbi:MAG: DUF3788 family protein [Bacteroidia bacterium]|jgi:Protein of unknown function (DUF3788)